MKQRFSKIVRKTKETEVEVELNLDKVKPIEVETGVGFLDHMLQLLAYHGEFSLEIRASGDVQIDDHHLVEDVGIALGQAFSKALGSKAGISRYGNFLLPMDEALSYVAIDFSGRPYLEYNVRFKRDNSRFDFGLLKEFFYAFTINAGITLHIEKKKGINNHHIAEAVFKGLGRAIAQAVSFSKKRRDIPSSKGKL
jgi:imidazoleglycerol phosphate dehydratase HisB